MEKSDLKRMYIGLLKAFGPLIAICMLLGGIFIYDAWGVKWVKGEYRQMVNGGLLVQSGASLKEVMAKYSRADRNQVQPFLDGYSVLLDEIVAMERGKDAIGFAPICDSFPEGSAQPAWAAIIRSGAIHISSDGKGRVRIYLPVTESTGNVDAKKTYSSRYSLLRHPLTWLAANNKGAALNIEVFCFNNDYGSLTLNLSMQTHTFTASQFPSSFLKPLNLNEIAGALTRAAHIKGAKLGDGALDLAAKEGAPMTIAGAPVSLADLAVAYRACFYPGANEPYVSLDRHRMPTKVTVNFGGYLEDTRIGSVLLESDKRFKSLSTGLSPDGIADIASNVKTAAPAFAPEDERAFSSGEDIKSGWQGTRFWFYPDSISLETDLSGRIGVISSPRFTADAERSMDDIRQLGLAKESAKRLLAPETKAAIAQLNSDYDKLVSVFPELKELDSVGEIMGLFVWAKQSPGVYQVDLDELLSVELPAFRTPREKDQLISTSLCVKKGKDGSQQFSILRTSFTDKLKSTFSEMRFSQEEFSALIANSGANLDARIDYQGRWTGADAEKTMSELLSTKELVHNFADVMNDRSSSFAGDLEAKNEITKLRAQLAQYGKSIDELDLRLESLKRSGSTEQYNALVPVYNELIGKHRSEVEAFNSKVNAYNERPYVNRSITHIGGGISVRPSAFKMATVSSSREIEIVSKAFSSGLSPEGWVISASRLAPAELAQPPKTIPPATWIQYDIRLGTRSSSTAPSGIVRDTILTTTQTSLTGVSFKPDGSQECHVASKSDPKGGVTTYTFSRVAKTRYIRPDQAPSK